MALETPQPDLRARIEAAIADKPLRLLRIHSHYPNAGGDTANSIAVDLDSLTPQEIFARRWQAEYGETPPEAVARDFATLVQEVQDAEPDT